MSFGRTRMEGKAVERDGGPAFPNPGMYYLRGNEPTEINPAVDGMSLRDWFAGQALTGFLTQTVSEECESGARDLVARWPCRSNTEQHTLARLVYSMADAMLATREARS
jgi:hypothetical protein